MKIKPKKGPSQRQELAKLKSQLSELQAAATRYRTLVEHSLQGITILQNGRIVFANDAFATLLGYSVEALLQLDPDQVAGLIHPDDRSLVQKRIAARLAGEPTPHRYEVRVLRRDGNQCWLALTARSISYDGNPAILTFSVDITSRKRAEEAMRLLMEGTSSVTGDAFFRSLVRHLACALQVKYAFVAECNEDDKTRVRTLAFWDVDHFGDNVEYDLSGTPCEKVVHGQVCYYPKRVQRAFPKDHDLRALDAESYLGIPIFSASGEVVGHLAVLDSKPMPDEPEELPFLQIFAVRAGAELQRKRAEEARRESEKRFRHLFENSPLAIFVHDVKGNLLAINPAACRLHGMDAEELIRKNVRELVPPDQAAAAVKFVEKMFHEGSGYIEGTTLTKAGRHVPVEIWVRRIDYLGQPALLFHVSDISLRKELEQKLLQSQKMEAVGRLVGGVAHDFNNLLTVIIGNTQFGLLDAPAGSPLRNDLQKIEEAAMQARDLVSQLLTFSRNQIMEPKQLCLNQIVSNHINMLRRIIGEQIRIETRLEDKLWPIRGDPAQLQQLLMNLSVNAKDAMPDGGTLTIITRNYVAEERLSLAELQLRHQVESREPVRFVELRVEDTGLGIEKASLSRLFDPFFTTKDVGKGTGLGLAVVYGIVNQHGGFIKVDSKVGEGTCFKIYFPTVGEGELSERVTEIKEPIPRGNETILVVEDDRTVLNVARRILTNLGYRVFAASDGETALRIFREKQDEVEALILDVVMPGWSGPKTYQEMTQIRPDLAVIFVTGYDVKAEMEHLDIEENPKTALLQKPYTQETLAQKVRAVLDAR